MPRYYLRDGEYVIANLEGPCKATSKSSCYLPDSSRGSRNNLLGCFVLSATKRHFQPMVARGGAICNRARAHCLFLSKESLYAHRSFRMSSAAPGAEIQQTIRNNGIRVDAKRHNFVCHDSVRFSVLCAVNSANCELAVWVCRFSRQDILARFLRLIPVAEGTRKRSGSLMFAWNAALFRACRTPHTQVNRPAASAGRNANLPVRQRA